MSYPWDSYFAKDAKTLEKFSESPDHSYAFLESVTLNAREGDLYHFLGIRCLKYGIDYLERTSV